MPGFKMEGPRPDADDDEEDNDVSTDDEVLYSDFDGEEEKSRDVEAGMESFGHLRLRPDISLEGENYAGTKSSRKSTLGQDELRSDDDDGDLEERLQALYGASSSDEEEQTGIGKSLGSGQDDELDVLTKEYEKLREEEEKGLQILSVQEKDSHLKGQAVQHQKALWDRALEIRISLQKMLTIANRLPNKEIKSLLCQPNENVTKAYSSLNDSVVRTLDCLKDLETVLLENNTAIEDNYLNVVNENGKREATAELEEEAGSDTIWENLDLFYSKIAPYRDNALDRWQRKTQIYSGAVAKVKLRAFNQSVSQQVASTMRDSSRLVSRVRLKSGSVHVLGHPRAVEGTTTVSTNTVEESESFAKSSGEDQGDPETFDDSEFYQQLLREFLESSDPSAVGSMSLYTSARQHNKKRKQVDRRASKGRKLRYNVFEPLVNFMAPKPRVLPPMANQLFSNLFGRQIKVSASVS